MQDKRKITCRERFTVNGVTVWAEWSDTMKGFSFRLKAGAKLGQWCSCYESFAQLEYNGKVYFLGTAYWTGSLPIETPFEVIKGKKA